MARGGIFSLNFHPHGRILSGLGLQQSCTRCHNCYEFICAAAFLLATVNILVPLLYLWEYFAMIITVLLSKSYTGQDY